MKRKVIDYLEQPKYANMEKFCKKQLELSEHFWSMGNQDTIAAIKTASEQVLSEIYKGEIPVIFEGMDIDQIQGHFHNQLIAEYERIPKEITKPIRQALEKHIKQYLSYANKLNMHSPVMNELTTREHYLNYLIVERIVPHIEFQANKGKKK